MRAQRAPAGQRVRKVVAAGARAGVNTTRHRGRLPRLSCLSLERKPHCRAQRQGGRNAPHGSGSGDRQAALRRKGSVFPGFGVL